MLFGSINQDDLGARLASLKFSDQSRSKSVLLQAAAGLVGNGRFDQACGQQGANDFVQLARYFLLLQRGRDVV